MKRIRVLVILLLLTVLVVTPTSFPLVGTSVIAEAATIKLSNKTLNLEVGKSKTLKISGTKSKVKWSTSKKNVATVTTKGKVTAISAGTTTITAVVDGKKFTCKVTVKEAANPYLANAPFEAAEFNIDNINLVIPKDWIYEEDTSVEGSYSITLAPNLKVKDVININVVDIGETLDYDILKEELNSNYSTDLIKEELAAALDDPTLVVSNFTTSDFKAPSITAYKIDYTLLCYDDSLTLYQTQYLFCINQYLFTITTTSSSDLDIVSIAEYMLQSVVIKNK